ncbi:MAG: DUF6495 family protein [Flavobacteriales bacterium]|nr:DUF6495 family protein [Flavobacteriales bacterium]
MQKASRIPGGFFISINPPTFAAMRYRKLHLEELEELRSEFVQFLAANSIPADEWEELKKKDKEKAETLIEMFSDIFWEKALGNIQCVELREPKRLRVVRFEEEEAKLIEMRIPNGSSLDFTNGADITALSQGKIDLAAENLEMYTGQRAYSGKRNEELFGFIVQGAQPCKLVVWETLRRMIK